jgi:hypothetical protein
MDFVVLGEVDGGRGKSGELLSNFPLPVNITEL